MSALDRLGQCTDRPQLYSAHRTVLVGQSEKQTRAICPESWWLEMSCSLFTESFTKGIDWIDCRCGLDICVL
jgi:hypothetical protein